MGRIGRVLCADWFRYTTFSSSPRAFHFCLVCRAIERRPCGRVLAQGRAASLAVGQRLSPPAAARLAPSLTGRVRPLSRSDRILDRSLTLTGPSPREQSATPGPRLPAPSHQFTRERSATSRTGWKRCSGRGLARLPVLETRTTQLFPHPAHVPLERSIGLDRRDTCWSGEWT